MKQFLNGLAAVIGVLLATILVLGLLYVGWHGWKAIWPDHFMQYQLAYCLEDKKITKADPLYEDNGKYEDEAYRVTYDDGSVGLVDQAQMRTGKVCTKTVRLYGDDPRTKTLTRESDY